MPRCKMILALKLDGVMHVPGAVVDFTDAEIAALPAGVVRLQQEVFELRTDGPTLEEYEASGYSAENYPPSGFMARESPRLDEFRLDRKAAALKLAQARVASATPVVQAVASADDPVSVGPVVPSAPVPPPVQRMGKVVTPKAPMTGDGPAA